MVDYGKVEIGENRHDWITTPLPEQVVLVTTADKNGQPHIATKTRFSIISYGPPTILVFACRAEYLTASNLRTTGQFVINVPGDNLVATSWIIGSDSTTHGMELFDDNGLNAIPGLKVAVPRIAECRAHIECEIEEMIQFGPELAAFGRIVSVSMDQLVSGEDKAKNYRELAPFFFLDAGWTAPLGFSRPVEEPVLGPSFERTTLVVTDLERSRSFYSTVFDWPVRIDNADYVEFDLPGGFALGLTTCIGSDKTAGQNSVVAGYNETASVELHLRCYDLLRVSAGLVSANASMSAICETQANGDESVRFSDPDGNVIVVSRPANQK